MNDIIMVMISYLGIILISFFIMNWLQRGLLFQFLMVKTSRGKKVLCKIRGVKEDYYRAGLPFESSLKVKFRGDKETCILEKVPVSAYYRSAGVDIIDIDEMSKYVIKKDWVAESTHDPRITDQLIKRALMSGGDQDIYNKIIIVGIVIIIIAVIILHIRIGDITTAIEGIKPGVEVIGTNL